MKEIRYVQVFYVVHGERASKTIIWQGEANNLIQFIVEWAARNNYQPLCFINL